MKYANFEKSPIEVADAIKEYIRGKKVCDIGSGDGYFARAMKQYTENVRGIESDPDLALTSNNWGIPTRCDDFMAADFSQDEVLYTFMSFMGLYALTRKLAKENWHGTVISLYYPLHQDITNPYIPTEVIHVDAGSFQAPALIYKI